MRSRMLARAFPIALLSAALAAAGCTNISETRKYQSSNAPHALTAIAVELVTPRFESGGVAADAALREWTQITALARVEVPRVFARAQVTAAVSEEGRAPLADRATARYVLVITLSRATAGPDFHNETARITLVDLQTRKTTWDGDTFLAGGARGFEAADIDKFLAGVIAAMHADGIFEHLAT